MAQIKKTFQDLAIGDTFDCVDDSHPTWNSFYDRCQKTGTRTYVSVESGLRYRVGSIKAKVFHVKSWLGDSNV